MSEFEDDENHEISDEEDVINFSTILFDQFIELSKDEEKWTLKNGKNVRNALIRMMLEVIKQAKEI
ncbi:4869_t:CDS:2 [Funneliformis mosseae]|uniref:4869_t:CDS:1 n=1 Tax=Funneliformis mosseae TaxID=27381 RepID=A0A9N9G7L4_FUNMO|nr:4869_t:CDS:2 [Funneliformis mosseae]